MIDKQLGISIRFIREYRPDEDRWVNTLDRVMFSCLSLGHTFQRNIGEEYCGVCGIRNPFANLPMERA